MTRRKSVQQLVSPLRKLSLLSGSSATLLSFQPDLEFVPEQQPEESNMTITLQTDILSLLPIEITLKIFSLLTFQDLIKVQLTCRLWSRLTQDISIWKSRLQDLNNRITDIYAHQPNKFTEACSQPWKTRYCQAITLANWRMGTVQKLVRIDDNSSKKSCRLLSVKLRNRLLVTLGEDNTVKLYEYSTTAGFSFRSKWFFGDPITQPQNSVECIDVLPDINILVVAQRGSKCMFYDINKDSKHDPIQVLKGGSHPWFVPDSISVNQDYFAVSGRKPSAVFVWNWRKGVRLSNRAFDNQPHNVFLSGNNVMTVSVDGLLNVFDIFDNSKDPTATHYLSPCSIPSIEYDNSLSIIIAPYASRRIHHYRWSPSPQLVPPPTVKNTSNEEFSITFKKPIPVSSASSPTASTVHPTSIPSRTRRLSTTFINLLGLKSSTSSNHIPTPEQQSSDHQPYPAPKQSMSANTLLKKSSKELYKSVKIKRHSSYNDYGYACQMKTDHYIRQSNKKRNSTVQGPLPNFQGKPKLVHSIRTTPLGSAAQEVVNVAVHGDRIATVNKSGDISLYAFNGATAARVALSMNASHQIWMEVQDDDMAQRDDDDLSDGYDFVRSRLAMGDMGIVYASKNGTLWWLDFGCRPIA